MSISPSALTIGIDVGGTKVLAGVVDSNGQIISRVRKDTPKSGGPQLVEVITEIVQEINQNPQFAGKITGVGLSWAGLISSDRSTIIDSPNISNCTNYPIGKLLSEKISLPVIVENDASAALWAEYKFGVAQNLNPVMFFIIGTGMGGGLIVDGNLHRGYSGAGAEFGHMIVQKDGQLCGCGTKGCIEQYASGTALLRIARELIQERPAQSAALLAKVEGKPENLTGSILTAAARENDEIALAAFKRQADWLGMAMASYTLILDPQAIIIGGGVVEAGELLIKPAAEAMVKYMPFGKDRNIPQVLAAKFGNDAGLVGAANLARN